MCNGQAMAGMRCGRRTGPGQGGRSMGARVRRSSSRVAPRRSRARSRSAHFPFWRWRLARARRARTSSSTRRRGTAGGSPSAAAGPRGAARRPPVLLVHGIAMNRQAFDFGGRALLARARTSPRAGFDCFALDLRGHGGSRRGPHRALDARHYLAEDLPAALDAIREATGEEQVLCVGHSQGALLGMAACALHPDADPRRRRDRRARRTSTPSRALRALVELAPPRARAGCSGSLARTVAPFSGYWHPAPSSSRSTCGTSSGRSTGGSSRTRSRTCSPGVLAQFAALHRRRPLPLLRRGGGLPRAVPALPAARALHRRGEGRARAARARRGGVPALGRAGAATGAAGRTTGTPTCSSGGTRRRWCSRWSGTSCSRTRRRREGSTSTRGRGRRWRGRGPSSAARASVETESSPRPRPVHVAAVTIRPCAAASPSPPPSPRSSSLARDGAARRSARAPRARGGAVARAWSRGARGGGRAPCRPSGSRGSRPATRGRRTYGHVRARLDALARATDTRLFVVRPDRTALADSAGPRPHRRAAARARARPARDRRGGARARAVA